MGIYLSLYGNVQHTDMDELHESDNRHDRTSNLCNECANNLNEVFGVYSDSLYDTICRA